MIVGACVAFKLAVSGKQDGHNVSSARGDATEEEFGVSVAGRIHSDTLTTMCSFGDTSDHIVEIARQSQRA